MIENCALIKKAIGLGIGKPEIEKDGKCLGYGSHDNDDEPCEECKTCNCNNAFSEVVTE